MSGAIDKFYDAIDHRHEFIAKWKKESGRKVSGFFCDYVPEEIMWAAGFSPIRITGGTGNVVAADKHMQSNVCSFARLCFDQALNGVFDYLDALVIPHTCDIITKMNDLWAYRMKDPALVHYLWVPHKVFDKDAFGVMLGEVKRMRKAFEELTGAPITDEKIAEAIGLYDKARGLMKHIYEMRKSNPPRISGVEAFAVSLSSFFVPKDLHIQWMEKFLTEREGDNGGLAKRPRVIVSASMIEDLDLMRAIESSGAWVVADSICTGSRYFYDLVGGSDTDPMKALTKRYLEKLPCPRSVDSMKPLTAHILDQARDYGADGLLFYILRCCDAHIFQYPLLKERAEKAGLRTLYIQGDQTVGINETIENRIKAFTEILSS